MIVALLFTAVVGAASQVSAPAKPPSDPSIIRIHVSTDEGGDPEELASRRESVRHLLSAIGDKKKANIIAIETSDDADVMLDVEGRSVTVPKVVFGLGGGMGSPNGRPPGAPTGPVKLIKLKVTMSLAHDGDPIELANKNRANETASGWKSAADDVVKQVEKWIQDHRAQIIAARRR